MTSIINTISQKLTRYFLTATKYFYFLSNSNHSFFVPFISIKRQTKTQTLNKYPLSVICKSSVTSTILIICEISIILNRDGKYIYTVYIHLPYIHVYTRLLKRGPYIHVKNVFYNHIGYYYLKQPAHGESITTGG